MAYNTRVIKKDSEGNPISQYFNPVMDEYEPVIGSGGGNAVVLYNEDGTENNELSLIPILDKLTQLTGTILDEETRKSNELLRIALYDNINNLLATGQLKGDEGDKGDTGSGLEFNWLGTQLGIRIVGEPNYIYVDLKGDKGDKGDTGDVANLTSVHIENALGYSPEDKLNIGSLSGLNTTNKSDIVSAINEVDNEVSTHKVEKATQEQLGHVKAGNNITIDVDGTINAKGGNVDSVNGKTGEVVIDVSDIPELVGPELALGHDASAGNSSVTLGRDASAGNSSVTLGRDASAGNSSVTLGRNASAVTNSVALGRDASADSYSVALGRNTSAESYSVALGHDASAGNINEGILGSTHFSAASKWIVPGSFTVSGTKNFEIPHPKPEKKATHRIRHGAVESPTAGDTLYRYKVDSTRENDLQIIELPDYFIHLNKDVQIFVTPQGHFGNGFGIFNEDAEQLEIHCQYEGEYNVLVIGTRNDNHQSVQDWGIKGVEREIGESWTRETYAFSVDEIMEVEEIKEGM